MLANLYQKYKNFTPFSESEAWGLFRLAAFGEAIGWSLLIIGIACKRLPVWWHEIPVGIGGRLHGVLFLLYIVAAIILAPSLNWSVIRTIIAGLFSMPPYGSLVFEKYESWRRERTRFKNIWCITAFKIAVS